MIAAMLLALMLSACDQARMADPVGVGSGRDDLKRSPCACFEVPPGRGRG